ncbi:hypothetical protein AKJ65_06890 [candidate division MSBL1 archaeon SCGC-AAA259E19]|uniref:Integrase SAM-like N-terminal domain-containing protein n=1 Tax=candidate division MSBL1 archaeon SCGC-AAA259E19 TaxID=1698264 RepID=A0A133UF96_9EURY|nr:hypothetical protein AKJ65_06890 [candidate division MSBL1 archaeon SCGC-AAA259E19]
MRKGSEKEKEPWEVIRDENDELIDEFSEFLREAKGLAERTVESHAFNLTMLNRYLAGYEPSTRFEEVTPGDIGFFMRDWYIRKTGADSETMYRMPVSLKKFFAFLSNEKGVDVPSEEIEEEINSGRELFEDRLREWWNPELTDGWWTA